MKTMNAPLLLRSVAPIYLPAKIVNTKCWNIYI